MNEEEISKLLKDNPIKIIKFNDIEVPVEYLKQTTVNINGDDYIRLQQENKQLKEEINNRKNHYRNIVDNQLAECLEPDCEDFYLAEIEAKANTLDELKKWLEEGELDQSSGEINPVIWNANEILDKIKELEEGAK